MPEAQDFVVPVLGPAVIPSPLVEWGEQVGAPIRFTPDGSRVLYNIRLEEGYEFRPEISFERAGPRRQIYFDPQQTTAAIVTCGGLCPGLNNVIRSIVMQLWWGYGVRRIFGVRYGYRGLHPDADPPLMPLDPYVVADIHRLGGTMLGSSRGPGDLERMLETIERYRIDILFTLGGDGTQRGAMALAERALSHGRRLCVVGVPKTIDNDIPYVFRTFGYATAVAKADEVIQAAHAEARGSARGIGLVKLMGREAGYIAAGATLTSQVVNFCLIPEVPFALEGPDGLLAAVDRRLDQKGHAVIVVAEGAGQDLLPPSEARDASGNKRLGDIGVFLRDHLRAHAKSQGKPLDIRYIDPSYYIRSAPATPTDSGISDQFARAAVHAAMAGKTNLVIGLWHGVLTHVPMPLVSSTKKRMNEDGEIWQSVLKATRQPPRMGVRRLA